MKSLLTFIALLAVVVRPGFSRIPECGIPNTFVEIEAKIIGGQEAKPHQFPWVVGLFFDSYFCAGSIISSRHILTAAHCADGFDKHEVVLGAHDLRDPSNFKVNAYDPIVHPEWDPYSLSNDIAILTLEDDIDFDAFNGTVRPVCLPSSGNDFTGELALLMGWGSDGSSGHSPVLKYVDGVPIMPQEYCEQFLGPLDEAVGCLNTEDGKSSCNGDSGGPVCLPGYSYVQIGIISFGSTLGCESGIPAMFTEVSPYRDWISSIAGV